VHSCMRWLIRCGHKNGDGRIRGRRRSRSFRLKLSNLTNELLNKRSYILLFCDVLLLQSLRLVDS
jgi:hypothetical protein